jgi:UDP-N-acetyl-D-mannosaminuronate dehydrogenase
MNKRKVKGYNELLLHNDHNSLKNAETQECKEMEPLYIDDRNFKLYIQSEQQLSTCKTSL